ncbi:MAG: BCCT family transporter [Phycisphaerae bacterium]|nr:BCCT family transporter [Phycisphaerae bacterium]
MKKIKPLVFLPPFGLLGAVVVLNFINKELFTSVLTNAYGWVLSTFGQVFALTPFLMLLTCAVIYFCPFGRVIIGGPDAKPLLTKWRWFTITLCTTIAIGILFWATAEPMFMLSDPPRSLGIAPNSPAAAVFAMDTILLHWTCTPYAIYTITGLMFAFAYYNMKKPFSLGSPLSPLLGRRGEGHIGQIIDAICLYALVAGMAGSLGAAMMLLGGGIHHVFDIAGRPSDMLLAIITIAIVGTFIVSAITGLMKGIRVLSNINTVFLIGLLIFIFAFGPTKHILLDGARSFVHFAGDFVRRNFWTATTDDPWANKWTIFYWANWFAWAPISVAFLGRISYGHSVRSFIVFNLVLPAVFSSIWMVVFGSTAIHMELSEGARLVEALNEGGPEGVLYALLSHFPLPWLLVPAFLITAFLSFVTAADSNTSAMGGLSSTGISPDSPEPGILIKIVWGALIGMIAWVMICFAHLDGIRMLSNLGGLPALFLCIGATICVIVVAWNPKKYDAFKNGYDEKGRPTTEKQRRAS